jgi:hypothetical protein
VIARRLFAVAGAVALVVAALAVRDRIEDDDAGAAGGDGRLVCATELATACQELAASEGVQVVVEPAGVTADALVAAADGGDEAVVGLAGWLAPEPWAEIVRTERARAAAPPLLDRPSAPIARTPLVLAIWRERAAALRGRCGRPADWRCLAEVAGRSWADAGGEAAWGRVRPGHPDPSRTGAGLDVLGQIGTALTGRTDFSTADLETDEFLGPFNRLERSVPSFDPPAGSPFAQMVLERAPTTYDAAGVYESEAAPALAGTAVRDRLTLLYPSPVVTADVVFAGITGADGASELAETVSGEAARTALARAGWRVPGEPRARGVPRRPALPPTSNLPSAGPAQALLATWEQVV